MVGLRSQFAAKSEGVSLNAWIKEADFACGVGDRVFLADELIQTLFGRYALSIWVTIGPVACSGCRSVDRDTEVTGRPRGPGPSTR